MKNTIKVLRAERNWSRGERADRLTVSRHFLNPVETEEFSPSVPLAFKIARVFGGAVEEMLMTGRTMMERDHAAI